MLTRYDCTIEFQEGKNNKNADALSKNNKNADALSKLPLPETVNVVSDTSEIIVRFK